MLRVGDPDAEMVRVARMRELLWAASELTRALSMYTRHALVDCCGTHGTGDLAADTRMVHAALARYAELVCNLAEEYSPILSLGTLGPGRASTSSIRAVAEAR